MIYLLDTDTIIHLMRGLRTRFPRNDKQRERQARGRRIFEACQNKAGEGHEIALSAISLAELEYGVCCADEPEKEREYTRHAVSPFTQRAFDPGSATRCYGEIRFKLAKAGATIGPNDLLIAAHAMSLDAILVSNNSREFERIKSLKCENWSLDSPGSKSVPD